MIETCESDEGDSHQPDFKISLFEPPQKKDGRLEQGTLRLEVYACRKHLADLCSKNNFSRRGPFDHDQILDLGTREVYNDVSGALAGIDPLYEIDNGKAFLSQSRRHQPVAIP